MILRALAVVLALALPGAAQDLPAPLAPFVSDFAGVLDASAEARLTERLRALRADPGVEVAVVTLARLPGGAEGLEAYATGLFNAWGIGDAEANDGVLLLLAVEDRAARIELGAGYPPVWDNRAQRVMAALMVPRFAAGDPAGGLEAGLQGLEAYILRPFKAGAAVQGTDDMPAVPEGGSGGGLGADVLIFVAFVAGIFGLQGWRARHRIGDRLAQRRPCPGCGRAGVVVERVATLPPGETTPGSETVSRRCPACGWHLDRSEPLPSRAAKREGGGSGGFGGGRSSGGGASGRW